jgi:hypothetical protein
MNEMTLVSKSDILVIVGYERHGEATKIAARSVGMIRK